MDSFQSALLRSLDTYSSTAYGAFPLFATMQTQTTAAAAPVAVFGELLKGSPALRALLEAGTAGGASKP